MPTLVSLLSHDVVYELRIGNDVCGYGLTTRELVDTVRYEVQRWILFWGYKPPPAVELCIQKTAHPDWSAKRTAGAFRDWARDHFPGGSRYVIANCKAVDALSGAALPPIPAAGERLGKSQGDVGTFQIYGADRVLGYAWTFCENTDLKTEYWALLDGYVRPDSPGVASLWRDVASKEQFEALTLGTWRAGRVVSYFIARCRYYDAVPNDQPGTPW